MNRTKVREKLRRMRETYYPSLGDFIDKTKLHDANVRAIEDKEGNSLPGIENMDRWVRACGLKLSEFIAEVEAEESGQQREAEHPLIGAARFLASKDSLAADALMEILKRMTTPTQPKNKRR